jgi:hypothetical protein
MMKHRLWLLASTLCGIGLLYVCTYQPHGEMIQTMVDIVHSFPKAREGEQY